MPIPAFLDNPWENHVRALALMRMRARVRACRAPQGYLYILHRGVVIAGGRLLTKRATWGEDIIIQGTSCPSLYKGINARAMNYVEVYMLSWPVLVEALGGFVNAARHIRKCAVRLAMRRKLVQAAKMVMAVNSLDGSFRNAQSKEIVGIDRYVKNQQVVTGSVASAPAPAATARNGAFASMFDASTDVSGGELALQSSLLARRSSTVSRDLLLTCAASTVTPSTETGSSTVATSVPSQLHFPGSSTFKPASSGEASPAVETLLQAVRAAVEEAIENTLASHKKKGLLEA